jgi:hypothetical protein
VSGEHAPLAPSSAHIWAPDGGCRGSVALQAAYPGPPDSPDTLEGDAAHWYVAEALNGRAPAIGALSPNGIPINSEMIDAAQGLLVDIRDTLAACTPGTLLRVEERVYAPSVHQSNWGTPDTYALDKAQRALHIWDYKYGHRFVDAVRNWQMLDYAVAILDSEGFSPDLPYDNPQSWHGWRISVSIAQPRNYDPIGPIREWHLSGEGLRDTYLPRLRQSAYEAMQPGAPYTTGEHCRDCTGRHVCPALQRAGAIAMDVSLTAQPVALPPHAVGLELRQIDDAIKRLEARKTGLEEHALGLLRGGTRIPFFSAQHASGRERWKVPVGEVFALGEMLGVTVRKPPEAITPAQARKAGIDAGVIQAYAETPKGALKLVRVDDDAAKLAFGGE